MISLSTILLLFSVVVGVFIVIVMALDLLLASRRSWVMGIVRVLMTVVSAVAAMLLARLLAGVMTDFAYDLLVPMLGSSVNGLLDQIPVGTEGMRVLVSLIVAPVLFFIIFIILRGLLCIPGFILGRSLPILREKTLRGVAMGLGALNGLLIAVLVMVPLCGFISMGGHVLSNTTTAIDECDPAAVDRVLNQVGMDADDVQALSDELNDQIVLKAVSNTVGRPIFNYLTSAKLDTTETHGEVVTMNLERETSGLFSTGIYLVNAMDVIKQEEFVEADKESLYAVADNILESDWIRLMATDAIVNAAGKWQSGEEFAGMARPELNSTVNPMINRMLDILATEQTMTLDEDLHTLLDIIGDLLVCNLLRDFSEPDQMILTISQSGMLDKTMSKLAANPRLAPLVTELRAMSVRLLSDMLGLDALKNGEHAELMDTVAGQLNNVLALTDENERHEAISAALSTSFADYGYDVPENVAVQLADQMIEELGSDGEIQGDELADYLVNHIDDGFDLLPDDTEDGSNDLLPDGFMESLPEDSFS